MLSAVASARNAARVAWRVGTGHITSGLYWVGIACLLDTERFGWAMPFAVAGLAAGLALFSALTFWLTRAATRLWHLDGVARLFAFAACWLLGAGLRTWLFTGFPWNMLGTVWAFSSAPLQPAALGGI